MSMPICAKWCRTFASLSQYVRSGAKHSQVYANMCEVVQYIRKSLPIYSERLVNICQTVHNDFIFTALCEYRSMYDDSGSQLNSIVNLGFQN